MDFAPMGDNAEDEPTWRSHCRGPALRRGPAPIGSLGAQTLRSAHKRRDVIYMEVQMNASVAVPNALNPQVGISVRRNQRRKLLLVASPGRQSRIRDLSPEPRIALKGLTGNINKSRQPKNRHNPNLRVAGNETPTKLAGWLASEVGENQTPYPSPAGCGAFPLNAHAVR